LIPRLAATGLTKIFAHRGGAGYFVENSLRAFEFALELGCDGAECDVHLSKDGEVIVHHNPGLTHHYARNRYSSQRRLPLQVASRFS
jgi:glycerophosphoryl diester phosphodiesterase